MNMPVGRIVLTGIWVGLALVIASPIAGASEGGPTWTQDAARVMSSSELGQVRGAGEVRDSQKCLRNWFPSECQSRGCYYKEVQGEPRCLVDTNVGAPRCYGNYPDYECWIDPSEPFECCIHIMIFEHVPNCPADENSWCTGDIVDDTSSGCGYMRCSTVKKNMMAGN